jgi:protoporphyrinogen oxidase
LSFLRGVSYSRSIHVVYGLERKLLERLYAVAIPANAHKRTVLVSEDANKCRAYVPEGAGLLHAVTYDAKSGDLWDRPDAIVAAEIAAELRDLLGSFPERPLFTIVHRWPQNMCIARPGHFDNAAAFERHAAAIRGLAFAGDYLSVPCVEGAVTSGLRAANHIIGR